MNDNTDERAQAQRLVDILNRTTDDILDAIFDETGSFDLLLR